MQFPVSPRNDSKNTLILLYHWTKTTGLILAPISSKTCWFLSNILNWSYFDNSISYFCNWCVESRLNYWFFVIVNGQRPVPPEYQDRQTESLCVQDVDSDHDFWDKEKKSSWTRQLKMKLPRSIVKWQAVFYLQMIIKDANHTRSIHICNRYKRKVKIEKVTINILHSIMITLSV